MLNVTCKSHPKNHPCSDFFPESCDFLPYKNHWDPPKKEGFLLLGILRVDFFDHQKNPRFCRPRVVLLSTNCFGRSHAMRSCCELVMDFTPEGKGVLDLKNIMFSKEITWNYVKLHPGGLTAGSPTKWSSKPPWLCSMLIFRGVNVIKCMHLPEAFRLCFFLSRKSVGISLAILAAHVDSVYRVPQTFMILHVWKWLGNPTTHEPMCSLSLWNPPVTSVTRKTHPGDEAVADDWQAKDQGPLITRKMCERTEGWGWWFGGRLAVSQISQPFVQKYSTLRILDILDPPMEGFEPVWRRGRVLKISKFEGPMILRVL